MHRSGFVFRWIIGLPWQPTLAASASAADGGCMRATIAAGSQRMHCCWLSLARSVNAEGSRVNDEAVSPPRNEKHSEGTAAEFSWLLRAPLFARPANCTSRVFSKSRVRQNHRRMSILKKHLEECQNKYPRESHRMIYISVIWLHRLTLVKSSCSTIKRRIRSR